MATQNPALTASSARPVVLRRRPDLKFSVQRYEGHRYYLVKDPVGLRYYRFLEEEYTLLELLDGRRSLDCIKETFEARFRPQRISLEELQHFIGRMHEAGLLLSDTTDQGSKLLERAAKRRRRALISSLTNILYIKLPGVDPERALQWLYPKFRWAFTPASVACAVLLMLSALTLVVVNFDEFRGKPELQSFHAFFNFSNIIWLWLALGIVKVIHEFGHGLSCTHFGGECHEMGVLFLVLSPCLYCNVSDAWMLPNKWHRIWISAAGIYVEVVLASIATFVWWYSEQGLVHNLAFSTMFVCSVSTILFNANPLLRYDGYYVVSDLMEIPNLRAKSTQLLQNAFARGCLGIETPTDPFMPKSRKWLFVTYAIASYLYRWFITIAILWFLYTFLKPYKLGAISVMLACGSLFTLLVVPSYRLVKTLFSPGRTVSVSKLRITLSGAVVAGLVMGFLLIPFPLRVKTVLTLEPRDADAVFVRVPGILKAVHAQPGQAVRRGDVLAELTNAELLTELEQLVRHADSREIAVRSYRALGQRGQMQQAEDALADARAEIENRERQIADLTLRAPSDGTIIPPPRRVETPLRERYETLPGWSRSPLEPANRDSYLEGGELLCSVGDPRKMEAVLIIDQADIEYVKEGQRVWIKLDALPSRTLEGRISEIARKELEATPPHLSSKAGGELATTTDSSGRERPLRSSYQARVPLPNSDGTLQADFRGRAKIDCGSRTLARRLWRYLSETFRFRL